MPVGPARSKPPLSLRSPFRTPCRVVIPPAAPGFPGVELLLTRRHGHGSSAGEMEAPRSREVAKKKKRKKKATTAAKKAGASASKTAKKSSAARRSSAKRTRKSSANAARKSVDEATEAGVEAVEPATAVEPDGPKEADPDFFLSDLFSDRAVASQAQPRGAAGESAARESTEEPVDRPASEAGAVAEDPTATTVEKPVDRAGEEISEKPVDKPAPEPSAVADNPVMTVEATIEGLTQEAAQALTVRPAPPRPAAKPTAKPADRTREKLQTTPLEHSRTVLMRTETVKAVLRDPKATGYSLLVAIGLALTVVGLVDLVLLWLPFRFENAAWVFGTVTQTFDSVPTVGLGALLLTYGLVRHPDTGARTVRVASIVSLGIALVLLLAGLRYVAAVPSVFAEAPAQSIDSLRRSVIQNAVEMAVYVVACLYTAGLLWRGVGKT